MGNNKLIIAAAGSGKTTFLVKEALKNKEDRILITTYTQANEGEIRRKFIENNRCIPDNVTIQTWFSFLLQHGVRPFQGQMGLQSFECTGLVLVNKQSVRLIKEVDVRNYYFSKDQRIYSNKLSKFVVKCNEISSGYVLDRLSRIYTHIFIDEVQDLAGYDLDFLKLLFRCKSNILMVGDPRQVTYLTHHEKRYAQYKNGKIKEFILEECNKRNNVTCEVDEVSLNKSHRNNSAICKFASKLYPSFEPSEPYSCCDKESQGNHNGIFLVKKENVEKYLRKYEPIQLRHSKKTQVMFASYPIYNFGESKGLTFGRVLIYPTKAIKKYLQDGQLEKTAKNKKNVKFFDVAKFYVAVTRARYSVGIVCDDNDNLIVDGIEYWNE